MLNQVPKREILGITEQDLYRLNANYVKELNGTQSRKNRAADIIFYWSINRLLRDRLLYPLCKLFKASTVYCDLYVTYH